MRGFAALIEGVVEAGHAAGRSAQALACDTDLSVVRRHSVNAAETLALPFEDINGRKIEDVVGNDGAHDLRNALLRSVDPARPGLILGMRLPGPGRRFQCRVHQYKGAVIVEFEPTDECRQPAPRSRLCAP